MSEVYVVYDVEEDSVVFICRSKEIAYREVQDYFAYITTIKMKEELNDIQDYVSSKDINFYGEYIQILEMPFYYT
jgi:hypothetical protein